MKNIIEGKDLNRVHAAYNKHDNEWNAQYNMLLMDGVTCQSCVHIYRCSSMFGQNSSDTACQFYPSRFYLKTNS